MDILQDALNLMIAPDPANLQSTKFTINGTFTPSSPVDGWNSVEIDVPDPVLTSINITENDTYTPPSGVDGYNSITVNVPTSAPAVIESLSITENGTYTAETGVDGYSPITVNVPSDTSIGYIGLYGLKEEEQHIGTAEMVRIIETGSCGNNATYALWNTGLLEINGTGDMTTKAFRKRTDIKDVIINNGITNISSEAFSQCSMLTSITIPNSVTSIDNYSFNMCFALTSITIPDNVTTIGTGAFNSCTSLASITIPAGVTTIQGYTFQICLSLANITILSTTPPKLVDTTTSLPSLNTIQAIYVPAESVVAYKTASKWSYYADKIQAIPDNS